MQYTLTGALLSVAVIVIAIFIAGQQKAAPPPPNPPSDAQYVTTNFNQLRLRYTDQSAPPIISDDEDHVESSPNTYILIHGFGGCLETWNYLRPLLLKEAGTRVISLDLAGSGFSDKPLQNFDYSFHNQGRVVADAMQQLKLTDNVVLIGHSSGALVAAAAAATGSSAVQGIVFVAPGFFQTKPKLFSYLPWLATYPARLLVRIFPSMLLKAHVDKSKLTRKLKDAFADSLATPNATEAIALMMQAQEAPYVELQFELDLPLHYIWTHQDFINPAAVEKIEKLSSSGKITSTRLTQVILEQECGHYIQHEHPEVLAKEIVQFSKRISK